MALEKFTKEEVYKFLNSLVSEGTVVFASAEDEKKFKEIVEENFKPQKGGGATANPPKEIDGIVYHYCRMFQDYLPENEMVFSQGKCKGISRIGQKLSYELNKKADELEKQSVKLFVARKFEEGEKLVAEAEEIRRQASLPATYIAERERQLAEGSMDTGAAEDENSSEQTINENDLV